MTAPRTLRNHPAEVDAAIEAYFAENPWVCVIPRATEHNRDGLTRGEEAGAPVPFTVAPGGNTAGSNPAPGTTRGMVGSPSPAVSTCSTGRLPALSLAPPVEPTYTLPGYCECHRAWCPERIEE